MTTAAVEKTKTNWDSVAHTAAFFLTLGGIVAAHLMADNAHAVGGLAKEALGALPLFAGVLMVWAFVKGKSKLFSLRAMIALPFFVVGSGGLLLAFLGLLAV